MFHVKRWASCSAAVVEQVEIAAKYSGYIDRQKDEVERAAHYETCSCQPTWTTCRSRRLSIEVRQKLQKPPPRNPGAGLAHFRA